MSCEAPVKGWNHIGGAECTLPVGHKGYHSGHTFTCDACGNTYRGVPYKTSTDRYGDPEFGFCFLCIKTWERTPLNYAG
jgi:hypothetical protein